MSRTASSRRITTGAFVIAGLIVAVLMAFLIAPKANPNPDGLEKVAIEHGLDSDVTEHDLADSPFADYGVEGVDNTFLSTGLAGLVGIAATFVVGATLVYVVRRSRNPSATGSPPAPA